MMCCPNCGEEATFTDHCRDSVETHGIDCGPYEHFYDVWLVCDRCGAATESY
jgi:hypothetical protein